MRKTWTKEELIAFEDRIADLYLDNKIPCLFHLSGGNEDQLIEIFKDIKEDDYVISNHRAHYHALLHGIPPEELEDMIVNGRSMFIYDRSRNFFVSSIIGGTPGIAAGIAWALKRKGSTQKVWCFIGDGTEDSGHLFEAVRYVTGWDLPCTFVIESNNYSVDATNEERWGAQANIEWDSPKVIKYHYERTRPHIRVPGMIDLSKAVRKTDEEYFPKPRLIPDPFMQTLDDRTYKEAANEAMRELAEDGAIFIGYTLKPGDAMGTLKGVPDDQKLEMPVAENLFTGMAIGMGFEGFKPVIYFERHDFMLTAMDAIVNHADKITRISHGQFRVPVVMRAVVADGGPFYSGPTHSQDITEGLRALLPNTYVLDPGEHQLLGAYRFARASHDYPTIVIERKSLYDK